MIGCLCNKISRRRKVKKMIYTVTFNPALDYIVHVDHFRLDAVNRASDEAVFIGGKGINVSAILKQLGHDSVALGFVAGFTGKEVIRGCVDDYGIQTDFIDVAEGMTRINVKLKAAEETEINGMGPKITDADVARLYDKLDALQEGDLLILSGSIPKCLPDDMYEQVLARLEGKGVKAVVDATGDLLVNVLKYKPFLIKPNNHEIEEIFNVTLNGTDDVITYAKKLQDMGAVNVLVSMAGDGSLLLDEHGDVHQMGVCKGTVKNSVGAGDSMVGGFVAGYLNSGSYEEALMLGTASGGATAFSDSLAKHDDIMACLAQLKG